MTRIRIILFCFLTSSALFAADLKLIVQSPSGERVSGVQVTLYRASDNAGVGILTTSGDGAVEFSGLADGAYQAVILAPGFAAQSLQVTVPQTEPLVVQLKLATTPQTVVVSATATPNTVNQTAVSLDMLNSDQLTLLNPPAAADALSYIPGAIVNTSGRRGSQASLFVRGGESSYNKVLIDGVPVNDPGGFYDFGVTPMNNIQRLEVVRGPESTIYGTDAMTSVVQLWTTTGTTLKPVFEFGADGGTFSTANGYVSVAGADKIYDYNFFLNQFDTQGQGINDAYSNGLQGGNVGIRFSPRVALRLRLRHSNNWTGVQSNWWFNGNPVLPPNSNQLAHQNNFLASAELAVSGPGAWQHTFSGYEYNHVQANSQAYVDPGREFLDSPFSNLSKYNRAGFEYQGQWTPRPWAQTTVGYTFEDENGFIQLHLCARHRLRIGQRHPRAALQQLSICAGTADLEARVGAGGSGLRQQLQLRQQSRAARFGLVPVAARQRDIQRDALARRILRGHQGAQLPAVVRHLREPIPRCPIPICNPNRTARGKRASSRDSSATSFR